MKLPSIPWRALATKGWALVVQVIRATAPDKAAADREPPPEPSATEAFDRWKDGRP